MEVRDVETIRMYISGFLHQPVPSPKRLGIVSRIQHKPTSHTNTTLYNH